MKINVSKNTTDAIKSVKSGSSGLGAWPATYTSNGVTSFFKLIWFNLKPIDFSHHL